MTAYTDEQSELQASDTGRPAADVKPVLGVRSDSPSSPEGGRDSAGDGPTREPPQSPRGPDASGAASFTDEQTKKVARLIAKRLATDAFWHNYLLLARDIVDFLSRDGCAPTPPTEHVAPDVSERPGKADTPLAPALEKARTLSGEEIAALLRRYLTEEQARRVADEIVGGERG